MADNGESVFVGLRSGKYLLLLNKTLVPLKKFSPVIGTHSALEQYTLQDIMWSKFDSIQTSREGSLVSISGGYRFVDSTSGGDKGVSATWIFLTSIADSDVDYDGWRDVEELDCGFNPTDARSSPTDLDNDSICDFLDDDDDNDGYSDLDDYFPFDPAEWIDTDLDGIGDNSDSDDDGDGWLDDVEDICLTDRLNYLSYPTDTDLDEICDYVDDDDDGDDVLDVDDLFPLDGTEFSDFDMDGIIIRILMMIAMAGSTLLRASVALQTRSMRVRSRMISTEMESVIYWMMMTIMIAISTQEMHSHSTHVQP